MAKRLLSDLIQNNLASLKHMILKKEQKHRADYQWDKLHQNNK